MMTPSVILDFLRMKAMLEGKEFSLPETELPDFPHHGLCGGYESSLLQHLKV
jgi:hypothetical protein